MKPVIKKDSSAGNLVFSRTVTLRDTWAKIAKSGMDRRIGLIALQLAFNRDLVVEEDGFDKRLGSVFIFFLLE